MGLTDTSLSVLPIGKLGFVTGNATKEVGGTILNKTNQLYNDIGQKSYIYFQTTAKPSILSGVKHNKETFGTIGDIYKEFYYLPNTKEKISFLDDAFNSYLPHGTPTSSLGGTIGFFTAQYLDNKDIVNEYFKNKFESIFGNEK